MKSLWNDADTAKISDDPLQLRVYTSRLLGGDPSLVLHGGGNTSVKMQVVNLFGDSEEVLYVKGSGWNLGTIEAAGFAPVRLSVLLRMAALEQLSDTDMVTNQRAAMLDPNAPKPSVEAILHAIIPFKFIDHSHADALVTITNTPDGEQRIRDLYGPNMLIVPYVMPGFILAKTVYKMTRDIDWQRLDGMVLLNHGLFTWGNDAKSSYERHIDIVTVAEEYLAKNAPVTVPSDANSSAQEENLVELAKLRKAVSKARGAAMLAVADRSAENVAYSMLPDVAELATRGLLTPDHVIRTKRVPLVLDADPEQTMDDAVDGYVQEYRAYFERHTDGSLTMVDPAPRWALWPGHGTVAFGRSPKETTIASDIIRHTIHATQVAEALAEWQVLGEEEVFEIEYWELQQAKLKLGDPYREMQGKIAIVSGAAGGIGRACAEALLAKGVVVVALDIAPAITEIFDAPNALGLICDLTDPEAVRAAVDEAVRRFGGLDIVVSNAGIFPSSQRIADMDSKMWALSLELNLSSHQRLMQLCIPYLEQGIDPAIVIIASKNVPAPGPGAAAYSVAKAGLTQLARVAALELGQAGIRVNVLHPNAVFDTALWTPELLEKRAASYGISVEEYKTNNLLRVEVSSKNVGELACAMAGPLFSRTTGAQVPIDGGNERVI